MSNKKIMWTGQGGYEIRENNFSLVIDPYLSDLVNRKDGLKRLMPPPMKPEGLAPDIHIITHEHIDHLDSDLIEVMNYSNTIFMCPSVSRDMLIKFGVPENNIIALDRGSKWEISGYNISAVYANHTGDSIGVVIETDGYKLYFTGDTLFDDKLGTDLDVVPDVMFSCINGRWGNMNHDEAAVIADRVNAKKAVPNHYGMFAENTADPADFVNASKKFSYGTRILYHSVWYDLDDIAAVE